MKQDIALNPIDISLLGAETVMLQTDFFTHLIKQFGADAGDGLQSFLGCPKKSSQTDGNKITHEHKYISHHIDAMFCVN